MLAVLTWMKACPVAIAPRRSRFGYPSPAAARFTADGRR